MRWISRRCELTVEDGTIRDPQVTPSSADAEVQSQRRPRYDRSNPVQQVGGQLWGDALEFEVSVRLLNTHLHDVAEQLPLRCLMMDEKAVLVCGSKGDKDIDAGHGHRSPPADPRFPAGRCYSIIVDHVGEYRSTTRRSGRGRTGQGVIHFEHAAPVMVPL